MPGQPDCDRCGKPIQPFQNPVYLTEGEGGKREVHVGEPPPDSTVAGCYHETCFHIARTHWPWSLPAAK